MNLDNSSEHRHTQFSNHSGADQLKNVSSLPTFELAEIYLEVYQLEYLKEKPENFLKDVTHLVNLFAGFANESKFFLDLLDKAQNTNCVVTAVDRDELPPGFENHFKQAVETHRFEFLTSDSASYLADQPDSSIDLVTAFGAEYVFRSIKDGDDLLKQFLTLLAQKLKSGGLFLCMPLFDAGSKGTSVVEMAKNCGLEPITVGTTTPLFRKKTV